MFAFELGDGIGAALLGGVVGSLLTLAGDFFAHRSNRHARAKYLATRVVIALDSYVRSCASALEADYQDEHGTDVEMEMPEAPIVPSDIDWTVIEQNLVYEILSLPHQDAKARAAVSHIWSVADVDQAKQSRDEDFVRIGLEANRLSRRLRDRWKVPAQEIGGWDPVAVLNKLQGGQDVKP